MSDIDKVVLRPQPPIQQSPDNRAARGASGWPRALAMTGILACGVALGASGLAVAAGIDQMRMGPGGRLAFIQLAVAHALDSVGATSEQEAKIHDIIAARFPEVAPKPEDRQALRKQALDLLAAPTIDRAAVERLRVEAVATFDAKSKAFVGGLLDIADQLNAQQRAQLTTYIAEMGRRGPPWMGRPDDRHSPAYDGAHDSEPNKD
ncbi:MAG: periplasmic heavy metal sensor [Hyphomicrobiales bacterium]|nr:periplasmic heavy metal sensor [Hyphomicrobiales bacterium]MBV8663402.1 periplasmic heavy metal sensor [Hyphomicrobiales bacterium]